MSAGAVNVKVVASRRERRQFQALPWSIYQTDGKRNRNWVPPLLSEERELLGWGNHPFYDNAEAVSLLVERNGCAVGRLVTLINRVHHRKYDENCGFFGFFECVDDAAAAKALFDAGAAWLRDHGMTVLRGPANPSLNHTCGLLVDGYDAPPRILMTYNPPYYGRLIEVCGLTPVQDLFAYELDTPSMVAVCKRYERALKSASRRGDVIIRTFNPKRFMAEVEAYLDIYNAALDGTWGFVPLQPSEAERIAKDLRYVIVPELAMFAEVAGKPVGAVLALPDYNQILRRCNGRLFPFGIVRLLMGRRKIDTVRTMAATMVPEYQHSGLATLLMHSLVAPAQRRGIKTWEFSWVLESNMRSRGPLEKMDAKITRRYRMYEKQL